ncbi:VCBS domain-containing protein [Aminobacter sp. P9b]|uniref:Ig-like domain-containing protein n=1 Tax=Aminobacter sp. P9b TaxID=3133697 RepID=UPI0032556061
MAIVVKGGQDDQITTGSANDIIFAGGGNNTVNAGDGNNTVAAGAGNDDITTGSGNDAINAGNGNNTIHAGDGNNAVNTGNGLDEVVTGSGDDAVNTGGGDDTVSLGGGDNTAYLGSGNDTVNFVWTEGAGNRNVFYGQGGQDKLRITLTADEAQNTAVLADLAAFQAHLATGSDNPFRFTAINLAVADFESVELIAPVLASDDTAEVEENGAPVAIDVLANDTDLLAPDNSALSVTDFDDSGVPAGASLTLNPDNTFSFDPGTAFDHLAAGEKALVQFTYTVSDNQGFEDTATATVTITGTNDDPVISVGAGDSSATTLAETDAALTTGGTLTVTDVDLSDTVSPNVQSVVASGTTLGLGPDNAALLAMLTVSPATIDANSGDANNLTWSFNSGSEAFDYLGAGESLVLTYTVRTADGAGAFDEQTLMVTVTGTTDEAQVVTDPLVISATSQFAPNQDLTFGSFFGMGKDPVTGEFYISRGYGEVGDGSLVHKFANSTDFISGNAASSFYLSQQDIAGTYFSAHAGKIIGRSDPTDGNWPDDTKLGQWDGTTGGLDLVTSSLPVIGGDNFDDSFDWGGFSAPAVMQSDAGMFVFGKVDTSSSNWQLIQIDPTTLSPVATETFSLTDRPGFAFMVDHFLFIGDDYNSEKISNVFDFETGTMMSVDVTFSTPEINDYISNSLYDEETDTLYLASAGDVYVYQSVSQQLFA